jgi:hypothetical protein
MSSHHGLQRTSYGCRPAGVPPAPPAAACRVVAADKLPLTLLQLPDDILIQVFGRLDPVNRARVGATSYAATAARRAVAASQPPLMLLQLPDDILVQVFCQLGADSFTRVCATCSELGNTFYKFWTC